MDQTSYSPDALLLRETIEDQSKYIVRAVSLASSARHYVAWRWFLLTFVVVNAVVLVAILWILVRMHVHMTKTRVAPCGDSHKSESSRSFDGLTGPESV